jgi:SAM-dependent methyltransferase
MLRKIIKKLYWIIVALISGLFWYTRDWFKYKNLLNQGGKEENLKVFPQIFDRAPGSHTFDKHYVYMDRWAFKQILKHKPSVHIDVGSSIRFLSMVSAITQLKFVDIRPIKTDFDNFECITGSILNMPFESESVVSLSCLHVAEHIGLGRYGDPLDVLGTKKACRELARVLAPGGRLYFALPIGKSAIYFNAHRVHDPETILQYFQGLRLNSFSVITDQGQFMERANIADYKNATYACGCFEFTKD